MIRRVPKNKLLSIHSPVNPPQFSWFWLKTWCWLIIPFHTKRNKWVIKKNNFFFCLHQCKLYPVRYISVYLFCKCLTDICKCHLWQKFQNRPSKICGMKLLKNLILLGPFFCPICKTIILIFFIFFYVLEHLLRGVFRTQSIIHDGAFLCKIVNGF